MSEIEKYAKRCSVHLNFSLRLLKERAHGVPAWCMELLRDLLDNGQLIITIDAGQKFESPHLSPDPSLLADFSPGSKGRRRSDALTNRVNVMLSLSTQPSNCIPKIVLARDLVGTTKLSSSHKGFIF